MGTTSAVAILGPRQSGKSTLAKAILEDKPDGTYLDLERPPDLRKYAEPELFFNLHQESLICQDEVQRTPEIFPVLRSINNERRRRGQFLILGSASPGLIRQSSETRLLNQDQKRKRGYCASAITPFIFPSKADAV